MTRHDLAVRVMRDAATFTVDDARFSTGKVVGPSMLSRDGDEHARHRAPFVAPFRAASVGPRFAEPVAQEAASLIDRFAPAGRAELRRSFAGPLAAAIITRTLGLDATEVADVLGWYDAIVAAVTEITAGQSGAATRLGHEAFGALRDRVDAVTADRGGDSLLAAAARSTLTDDEVVANAAVLLFGGIETTEGMITNAVLALLEHPDQLAAVTADPRLIDGALDESLRLEPAAAVIDRYATRDVALGDALIARGELVRISIAAANRDPEVFADPDRFRLGRPEARRHLAFAHGPHVCVGVHLARLEARTAIASLLERLPGLRADPERPAQVTGLVFRKPARLDVRWG